MYTLILYEGEQVIDSIPMNDTPTVEGASVHSKSFSMEGIKKEFIIIEGEFDGVLDTSKDVKNSLKSEAQKQQESISDLENSVIGLMDQILILQGGGS